VPATPRAYIRSAAVATIRSRVACPFRVNIHHSLPILELTIQKVHAFVE
jgi:hypothetical protein